MSEIPNRKSVFIDRSASRHYTIGEKKYFSSSQVCALLSGDYGEWYTPDSPVRGNDVHIICETLLICKINNVPFPELPDFYKGYSRSFTHFMNLNNWIVITNTKIEQSSYYNDPTLPIAGTPDMECNDTIVELKTGQAKPWHYIQCEIYMGLTGYTDCKKCLLVYLNKHGKVPKVFSVKSDPSRVNFIRSAVNVMLYREKYGLKL